MTLTQYLNNALQKPVVENTDFLCLLNDYLNEREKSTNDIKYLKQFYKFLKYEYGVIYTNEITEELFKKFLLYHIPKTSSFLTHANSKQLLKELGFFIASERMKIFKSVKKDYTNIYYEYLEEFPRIMSLQKEIKNETGYPVLKFDPIVIDMVNYRKEKILEKYNEKAPIMEQGYFQVMELFGSGVVIFKKLFSTDMYIKIHLGRNIMPFIKKYDIVHMRISRRLFFTTWSLESVKSCFHKDAEEFLKEK